MTDPQPMPCDPGNPWATSQLTAQLSLCPVPTDQGQRMMVTIRCGTATLTCLLVKEDVTAWGETMFKAGQSMSGLIVPGLSIDPNPNGHLP